jgi:hypothetical protein
MSKNGDDMKKPIAGDALIIPARTQGRIIEATLRSEQYNAPKVASTYSSSSDHNQGLVYVKNDSGTLAEPHSVLGVSDVLYNETDNEYEFRYSPTLVGDTPVSESHTGKWVVLAEQIDDGEIGRAYAAGSICAARVDVNDANHQYCEIEDDTSVNLASAIRGSARILYKESGTGVKWAIIQIGAEVTRVELSHLVTATGSFTTPDYITQMTMIAIGGGGGGGGKGTSEVINLGSGDGTLTFGYSGGGGGGGGFGALAKIVAPPATTFSVTIGAAGVTGGTNTDGTDGGNTIITYERYNTWPGDAPSILTAQTLRGEGGKGGQAPNFTTGGRGGLGSSQATYGATGGYPLGESSAHFCPRSQCGHVGSNGGTGGPSNRNAEGGLGGLPGHAVRGSAIFGRGGDGDGGSGTDISPAAGCALFIW